MFKRSMLCVGLLTLLVTLFARHAAAGGWVVVTLDDLPVSVQASTKVTVAFQINQHGTHPLELPAGEVTVVLRGSDNKTRLESVAVASGKPGHYTAELEFPSAGVWQWAVHPGGFPKVDMPELTVTELAAQPAQQLEANPTAAWWIGFVQHMISYLQQPQQQSVAPAADKVAVTDEAAFGKQLFLAKGCATCHVHSAVQTTFSVEVGPNLTTYKVIPAYVKTWLKDPKAIKPATTMPNLELKEMEIDALVAFLSTGH